MYHHRIFTLVSLLSLALCIATCIRWISSAGPEEHWLVTRDLADDSKTAGRLTAQTLTRAATISWQSKDWNRWHYRQFTISFGLLALLLAVLPSSWGVQYLSRNRKMKAGHCPDCGYDLRATPDRCPECGRAAC